MKNKIVVGDTPETQLAIKLIRMQFGVSEEDAKKILSIVGIHKVMW